MSEVKAEIWHDNFQNYKRYNIPQKAQMPCFQKDESIFGMV